MSWDLEGVWTLAVAPVDIGPTANAGSDTVESSGSTASLDGTQSSQGSSPIRSVEWIQTSGDDVTLLNNDSTMASYLVPQVSEGSATFKITLTDENGLSSSDTVTHLWEDRTAPYADAGQPKNITVGKVATLDSSSSTDNVGIVSRTWTQVSGASVELSDIKAVSPTFTPPSIGDYTFRVTVVDAKGKSDSATVTLNAQNAADVTPPTIKINVGDDSILLGNEWVDAGAIVVDNEDATRTIYADSVPPMTVPGVYKIPYTAVDKAGNSAVAYRTVTISLPQQSSIGGQLLKGTIEPGSYQVRLYTDPYDSATMVLDSVAYLSGKNYFFSGVNTAAGSKVTGFILHPTYGGVPISGETV